MVAKIYAELLFPMRFMNIHAWKLHYTTLELEIAKFSFKKLQNMQKSFKSIDLNSLIQSNKNKAVKMRMCVSIAKYKPN